MITVVFRSSYESQNNSEKIIKARSVVLMVKSKIMHNFRRRRQRNYGETKKLETKKLRNETI